MTRTHYSILLAAVLMLTVCLLLLRRPAELPPLAVPASVPSPARITVETPAPAAQSMDYESIRKRTAEAVPQVIRPQESLPPEPPSTAAQNPPVIAPEAPQNAQTPQPLYISQHGVPVYQEHASNIPPDQWTPRQRAYMEQNAAQIREHEAEKYRRKQFEKNFFDNLERAAIQREHDKQMRRHALGGGF